MVLLFWCWTRGQAVCPRAGRQYMDASQVNRCQSEVATSSPSSSSLVETKKNLFSGGLRADPSQAAPSRPCRKTPDYVSQVPPQLPCLPTFSLAVAGLTLSNMRASTCAIDPATYVPIRPTIVTRAFTLSGRSWGRGRGRGMAPAVSTALNPITSNLLLPRAPSLSVIDVRCSIESSSTSGTKPRALCNEIRRDMEK